MKNKSYTEEEKKQFIKKYDELRAQNMNGAQAIRELGLNSGTFYAWINHKKKRASGLKKNKKPPGTIEQPKEITISYKEHAKIRVIYQLLSIIFELMEK